MQRGTYALRKLVKQPHNPQEYKRLTNKLITIFNNIREINGLCQYLYLFCLDSKANCLKKFFAREASKAFPAKSLFFN